MTEFIKENRRRIESISSDLVQNIPTTSENNISFGNQKIKTVTDTTISVNNTTVKTINNLRCTYYLRDLVISDILTNGTHNDTPNETLIGIGSSNNNNRREKQSLNNQITNYKNKSTTINFNNDNIEINTTYTFDTATYSLNNNITEFGLTTNDSNLLQYSNDIDINIYDYL